MFDIPKTIEMEYGTVTNTAKASVNLLDIGNIPYATYYSKNIDGIDYYVLDLEVICDVRLIKLGGGTGAQSPNPLPDASMSGTYQTYIANQIIFTLYGDTIGIDLTNGLVTYGSGSNPFSLTRNELLQDGAKTFGVPTTQYLAERIIEQYKRGKETATILCSVSDYYDEVGTKIISIDTSDRMTFKEHDIVIPMVYGANGQDRPMSLYHNGRPKKFQVVQTEKFYDGAVWQKLTLQEYSK
jgi:hypothetical protein